MLIVAFLVALILSIFLTPYVGKLAIKIGATDKPNERKVHMKLMPRMGGLSIFISFMIAFFLFIPHTALHMPLLTGALVIIAVGIADDIYELRPAPKFLGQIVAALIIVLWGGLEVEFIKLPFGGEIQFGVFSIPFTILWVVMIMNAINFIDGLDGLAGGVSSIAMVTIGIMALIMNDVFVAAVALITLGSTLGFLKYNFHPAKIFMGDTGSMFLGFIIAVLSLSGFKNITVISLIVPIIILGVPISDTFFAIIRRLVHKKPISAPDKSHLHHCLLNSGFTHRQTVLIIYAMAASFGMAAIIFSFATMWGALLIIAGLLLLIELFVEKVGLIGSGYQPLLKMLSARNMKK
ncbi:glycosyltransferase family 4 protein [Bacillus massiliglaciei]|uniref:glycosyltransferase family 4 protein n=1 Tax=Bacillus massiliglaciei TaxID=1816693 RepID=UPI000A4A49A6|nr:MraY family glycosyltransferase [Bacillus massiliglaciei]